ncbi:MAG: hypothetical protein EOO43_05135 [Flavobacterium sp.]|nr:MAG: hypothetical protein EOO43_05135 [Flavobacterium sp.]
MARKEINPNSDKDYIDDLDIDDSKNFPQYLKSIKFDVFRHIPKLDVHFIHPISVISGTNRSGKSTILMALACSHYDFKKRNIQNGKLERQTWSSMMQFTTHDQQKSDWTYHITYKYGTRIEPKRGQRKASTKKWNGIGKKESQFKKRQVNFLDLDRILPARNFSKTLFNRARRASVSQISETNVLIIEEYISYILEEDFQLRKLAEHLDKDIFKYSNANEYSSYNAATGEEVLTKIILDVIEAPKNSLILIDEIEIGLHPKIQRRLIHVLYNIARNEYKQFILTSHSPTILSSVPDKSRIFIEKNSSGFKAIPNISVNAALSKMDSQSYPLIDLYCEDSEAKKIIQKALSSIQSQHKLYNFSSLVNIIASGSGSRTHSHYTSHKETYPFKKIKTGYACILDGDQKNLKDKTGTPIFPVEEGLHFLYSDESPEKFLVRVYLADNPDINLQYHLNNSNVHSLFEKMIERSICTTKDEAFEKCWDIFEKTTDGQLYFEELQNFIINMVKKYSPDL